MAYQKIKISSLELAPWNYKEDDAKLQAKLVKNIQSNGQVENIVVREIGEGKYEVVNGNHRLKAFREIGLSTVMAYNLGRITDEKAKRIAVELNETRFGIDVEKHKSLLASLFDEFDASDLLGTLPYDEAELESYLPDARCPDPNFQTGDGFSIPDYPKGDFITWDMVLTKEENETLTQFEKQNGEGQRLGSVVVGIMADLIER